MDTLRDFRIAAAGIALGSFFAWLFAGKPYNATTVVVLTALAVGLVELVAYLRRHLRWERAGLPRKGEAGYVARRSE